MRKLIVFCFVASDSRGRFFECSGRWITESIASREQFF